MSWDYRGDMVANGRLQFRGLEQYLEIKPLPIAA